MVPLLVLLGVCWRLGKWVPVLPQACRTGQQRPAVTVCSDLLCGRSREDLCAATNVTAVVTVGPLIGRQLCRTLAVSCHGVDGKTDKCAAAALLLFADAYRQA